MEGNGVVMLGKCVKTEAKEDIAAADPKKKEGKVHAFLSATLFSLSLSVCVCVCVVGKKR